MQIPEKYGDFVYFVREKEHSSQVLNNAKRKRGSSQVQAETYAVYCRHPASTLEQALTPEQQEAHV